MPRATWPLRRGSPVIRVVLTLAAQNHPLPLSVLADTGAGSSTTPFDLILEESDCLLCGGTSSTSMTLGGAYAGRFPVYVIQVQIPELGFDEPLQVIAVPSNLIGFEGVAAFRLLNRFTYGNFGNPAEFGLES